MEGDNNKLWLRASELYTPTQLKQGEKVFNLVLKQVRTENVYEIADDYSRNLTFELKMNARRNFQAPSAKEIVYLKAGKVSKTDTGFNFYSLDRISEDLEIYKQQNKKLQMENEQLKLKKTNIINPFWEENLDNQKQGLMQMIDQMGDLPPQLSKNIQQLTEGIFAKLSQISTKNTELLQENKKLRALATIYSQRQNKILDQLLKQQTIELKQEGIVGEEKICKENSSRTLFMVSFA